MFQSILVMVHDDDCGAELNHKGFCPVCGFAPDGQSVAFKQISLEELDALFKQGRTLLGRERKPLRGQLQHILNGILEGFK